MVKRSQEPKQKRAWTDEQRQAAAERMRKVSADRVARQRAESTKAMEQELDNFPPTPVVEKVRDPEVQAILDTMSPERKAKLAQIQAQTLATKEAQDAIARHDAEKQQQPSIDEPRRIGTREVVLVVRTDGTMAAKYGPCVCGAHKHEWHRLCLKEAAHV